MCKCAPALLTLRRQFDTTWPQRDRSSDGCCGDAAHAARKSDHNPFGGYAHAHDFDEDIAPGLGNAPLLFLVPLLLADDRAKYTIYERRIYHARCNVHGAGCFAAGGHPYSGVNAHEHHLHLSIRADATHDTRPWHLIAPPNTTPPPPREDVYMKVVIEAEHPDARWLIGGGIAYHIQSLAELGQLEACWGTATETYARSVINIHGLQGVHA